MTVGVTGRTMVQPPDASSSTSRSHCIALWRDSSRSGGARRILGLGARRRVRVADADRIARLVADGRL